MKARFTELLPWYVNGTLSETDRAWVDNYLREHPESRAELDFYQALKADLHDNAPKVPSTIGLAKTLQLVGADRPTLRERVHGFFAGFGLRPALAMGLVAVVALQGAVIAGLWGGRADDDAGSMRAGRTVAAEDGPVLKLNFSAEAKEADLRFALLAVQGTIVGGPGQLGDYYVRVPAGKEQAALAKLRGQSGVQSVELVPGLPARP